MLVFDKYIIGNKCYEIRRKRGMTREAVAEKANISDRTYADIERGTVNMRIETLLHICDAMNITPDEILTEQDESVSAEELMKKLEGCSAKERDTIEKIINIYLKTL